MCEKKQFVSLSCGLRSVWFEIKKENNLQVRRTRRNQKEGSAHYDKGFRRISRGKNKMISFDFCDFYSNVQN